MTPLPHSTAATARSAALRSFEAQWLAREADPLSALREEAMERFLRLGLPTPRDESWRYTNLRQLASQSFVDAPRAPAGDLEPAASMSLLGVAERVATVLMINGYPVLPASMDLSVNGIDISSLRDLSRTDPDLLVTPSATAVGRRRGTLAAAQYGAVRRRAVSQGARARDHAARHPARGNGRQAGHRGLSARHHRGGRRDRARRSSNITCIRAPTRRCAIPPLRLRSSGCANRTLSRVRHGCRREPPRLAGSVPGEATAAAGSSPSPWAAVWCAPRSKRS